MRLVASAHSGPVLSRNLDKDQDIPKRKMRKLSSPGVRVIEAVIDGKARK